MNRFVVELPSELQAEVARRASNGLGGESEWVEDAVREKLAACAQLEYLEGRAARGSREAYERVLAKVPAADPVAGDERTPSGLTNGSS
jgi:Arc/MetJ family transcription regulator